MDVILSKYASLAAMMLIGYISEKCGYVKDLKGRAGEIILKITLPLLVITNLSSQQLDRHLALNAVFVAGCALLVITFLFYATWAVCSWCGMSKFRLAVHCCCSSFGNVIFIGYPLCEAMFGPTGLFFASVYALVNDMFFYSLGLYGLSSGKGDLKKLINPNTISFVIGLAMMFARIKLPPILHEPAAAVGSATMPLSMLFIGCALAQINIRSISLGYAIYISMALKMLVFPYLAILLLGQMTMFSELARSVVIMQLAMPTQSMVVVLSHKYGKDTEYASVFLFVSIIFSLITMPIVYSFIK